MMEQKDVREENKSINNHYKSRGRKKKGFNFYILAVIVLLGLILAGGRFALMYFGNKTAYATDKDGNPIKSRGKSSDKESAVEETDNIPEEIKETLDTAKKQAMQYDYDAAIATLNEASIPDSPLYSICNKRV